MPRTENQAWLGVLTLGRCFSCFVSGRWVFQFQEARESGRTEHAEILRHLSAEVGWDSVTGRLTGDQTQIMKTQHLKGLRKGSPPLTKAAAGTGDLAKKRIRRVGCTCPSSEIPSGTVASTWGRAWHGPQFAAASGLRGSHWAHEITLLCRQAECLPCG